MDVVGTAVKQVVSLLCSRSGYFDQASLYHYYHCYCGYYYHYYHYNYYYYCYHIIIIIIITGIVEQMVSLLCSRSLGLL